MSRTSNGAMAVAVLAATAVLAGPAAAQSPSRTARVTDGETTLRLAAATGRALTRAGVRVSAVAPGRSGASGLTFPVTDGRIDPATLRGSVSHSGGIRFRAGGRSVVLRSPRYTIRRTASTLSALVAGRRVAVLRLDLGDARIRRGDGPLEKTAQGIRATLTATAARALNAGLATSLFQGGLRIGTVRTRVELGDAVFDGGATTLVPDPAAATALQTLGITLGTSGRATAGPNGIAFPITSGKVDARTLAGTIRHAGSGLTLTRGTTAVALTDFVVAIDDTPSLTARLGNDRAEILTLDLSAARRSTTRSTIIVENVGASLTAGSAAALNLAFGTTAFTPGLRFGTVTLRGRTA